MFKKVLAILLASFLLFLSACSKNLDTIESEGEKMVFSDTLQKQDSKSVKSDEEISFSVMKDIGNDNYIALDISTDVNLIGNICYTSVDSEETVSEMFYIEKNSKSEFRQILDFYKEHLYEKKLTEITLKNVDGTDGSVTLNGIRTANRELYEDDDVYLENASLKLGITMKSGGGINYLERKNAKIVQVKLPDGKVAIGSNYNTISGAEVMNDKVNLLNEYDKGRLIQQSYYGISSSPYNPVNYGGSLWPYNPVQGGDQYSNSSQIIDYQFSENQLYVKTRAMDWSQKDMLTLSYMENWYTIEDGLIITVKNRFVDFSGYEHNRRVHQEMPAFYGVIPLHTFVTYRGEKPFTGETLTYMPDLVPWAGNKNAYFNDLTENWSAWVNDDDFGVGLYVPGLKLTLTGTINSGLVFTGDASRQADTTYNTMIGTFSLKTYQPFSYTYYLSVDNVEKMRSTFNEMAKTCTNEDIARMEAE